MNDATVRLGYVGCGFMAQNAHLPNFSSIPGCRLVALAERRPRLAEAVADRYAIERIYESHHQLAEDPAVDAVALSAAFAEQGEIAADLLHAGKHVFMEKPMAVSVAQAERILEAARAGGSRLMVAYMKRYDPGNMLAQSRIAAWRTDGSRGPVLYARNHGFGGNWLVGLDTSGMITTDEAAEVMDASHLMPSWLPSAGGEGYIWYLQQWTHNINLLRFLLGTGDEARVRAVDLDADGMTGLVVLDLGGTRAVVESAQSQHHGWDEHTQVYFEKGWVRLAAEPMFYRPSRSSVEFYTAGEMPTYEEPDPGCPAAWPYREEAVAFIEALRSGEEFRSSGEDTLTDVRLCEQIYRMYLGVES